MRMAVIVSVPLPAQAFSLFVAEFYPHPDSCASMVRSLLLCRCHGYILESVFASRRVSPPAGCDCDGIALPVCKQLLSTALSTLYISNLGGFCICYPTLLDVDTFFFNVQFLRLKTAENWTHFFAFFEGKKPRFAALDNTLRPLYNISIILLFINYEDNYGFI